jgi:hypothetical protein
MIFTTEFEDKMKPLKHRLNCLFSLKVKLWEMGNSGII